ncbi:hypothetical protein HZS_160 [Henneguya salminicola]|nr:hypothetical protein HZS_160 [Henneguya salminicola]
MYAMKSLNKKRLKSKSAESTAVNERKMMANLQSDFIVNLTYSFQSHSTLFLVMDLMDGGDLAYHIRHKIKFAKWEVCIQFFSLNMTYYILRVKINKIPIM